ncbi:MAG TPA: non-homologous end-joining DNA ligase [Acidimicrobiia bacterium]|nr:non-homologous end-joining DNA ligase [Acidimicrobiia bacterium]
MPGSESDYDSKRQFDQTPEPPMAAALEDVDPLTAPTGPSFVIHQHYATNLHHDLRLEMLNEAGPVLVSWAVPKGVPSHPDTKVLAVRTEDHPIEYGSFSGSIPDNNYGAGEVRIFDAGTYEIDERDRKKISFRLQGSRLDGLYHLIKTKFTEGRESWLLFMTDDHRPPPEPHPRLEPMLATLVSDSFDDPAFQFEPKWDGIRALAVCREETSLFSRLGNEVTDGYPELHALHRRLVATNAILDGEIVAFDKGTPSFQKLQQRMHVRDRNQVEQLMKTVPVVFMAFDIIYLDGRDLTNLTLEKRRALLEEVVVVDDHLQVSPAIRSDGVALFEAAKAQDLEGIVAKRLTSTYRPGARSKDWLKIKTVFDLDAVVVGWTEGTGSRQGTIGSLVLALYKGDELVYVGNVGTGFNQRSLDDALRRLKVLGEVPAPFGSHVIKSRPELRKARWVPPTLVAKVEYRQLTDAERLRAPAFIEFRDDKRPQDCTMDQFAAGSR